MEPIELYATLRNVSGRSVVIPETNPFVQYEYHVTAADGQPVPMTLFLRDLRSSGRSTWTRKLEPGDSASVSFTLNRCFDLSLEGEYFVTAFRVFTLGDGTSTQPVRSNRISFVISSTPVRPTNPDRK